MDPKLISAISHATIALINLFFVYNLLFIQKRKDQKKELEIQKERKRSVKLSWAKELIIQPKWAHIEKFYLELDTCCGKLMSSKEIYPDRLNIHAEMKILFSDARKIFVDSFRVVNSDFGGTLQKNFDDLLDNLTGVIFDEGINFTHVPTFEKQIRDKIKYSKNDLIALVLLYSGD